MSTESTVVRTLRDGIITIKDSGGVHTYVVSYEPGDFTFDVPREAIDLYLDRDRINDTVGGTPSVRKGAEQPMTIGWSANMRDIGSTDATATGHATLPDILSRYTSGFIATQWTSTGGSNTDEFLFTVDWTVDGTPFGEADKTVSFRFVSLRGGGAEGKPNTIPVKGTSYALVPILS